MSHQQDSSEENKNYRPGKLWFDKTVNRSRNSPYKTDSKLREPHSADKNISNSKYHPTLVPFYLLGAVLIFIFLMSVIFTKTSFNFKWGDWLLEINKNDQSFINDH